jgi:hypothetical protein
MIHPVWEVNEGDIPTFLRRNLVGYEDPLVVLAPLNPFNTRVQTWLSRNDPSYTPLYIDNQENLEECDQNTRPSYDHLSLDATSIYAPPSPEVSSPVNYLEDNPEVSIAETEQAVASIMEPEPEPTPSEIAQFDEAASDLSSLLEDHSADIEQLWEEALEPPQLVTPAMPEVFDPAFDPDFQELVDMFNNPAMLPLPMVSSPNVSPTIQVHLNMNPHANLVTPEFEDNDLPSLHSLSPEPPAGQAHISVDELFYPLMDITNLPR